MSWVKLDDGFPSHPKIARAGGDAAWLHVCALCYAGQHLTDGRVPKAVVRQLSDRRSPNRLIARLIIEGLWSDEGDHYQINDYLKFNPSRADVLSQRETRSAAGRKGAEARWHADSGSHDNSHADGMADPNGKTMAEGGNAPDPSPTPKRERGSPPPQDFKPDGALVAWAEKNAAGVDLERETAAWVDWCYANGRSYRDLRAGWRTWMRRANPVVRSPSGRFAAASKPGDGPGYCDVCGSVNFLPGTGRMACKCEEDK